MILKLGLVCWREITRKIVNRKGTAILRKSWHVNERVLKVKWEPETEGDRWDEPFFCWPEARGNWTMSLKEEGQKKLYWRVPSTPAMVDRFRCHWHTVTDSIRTILWLKFVQVIELYFMDLGLSKHCELQIVANMSSFDAKSFYCGRSIKWNYFSSNELKLKRSWNSY